MDDGGEPVILEALLMMPCSFLLVLMTRLKPITLLLMRKELQFRRSDVYCADVNQ